MATITVLQNEFFSLWYHEESRIVHHQFHGFLYGKPFRDCLRAGLALMRERKATKWLSDDRANSAIPQEDFEWTKVEWQREALEAGWRYWAIVLPEKIVGQMSMQKILKQFENESRVSIELFTEPDPALEWLKSQQRPPRSS